MKWNDIIRSKMYPHFDSWLLSTLYTDQPTNVITAVVPNEITAAHQPLFYCRQMHAKRVGFHFAAVCFFWEAAVFYGYMHVIVKTQAKPASWLLFSPQQLSQRVLQIYGSQRLSSTNHKTFPFVGRDVTEPALDSSRMCFFHDKVSFRALRCTRTF